MKGMGPWKRETEGVQDEVNPLSFMKKSNTIEFCLIGHAKEVKLFLTKDLCKAICKCS